jgi:hypothetical protein
MACGVCGTEGHNILTCVYDAPRANISKSIPKSKRCECCGSYRYGTERHHTRGRGNASDFLDLCLDCHIACGHQGDFQNIPIKPRVCRVTGNVSYWCR